MPAPDAALAADLALMETAVREAGAIARQYFGGHYRHWDKGKGNPVTEADIRIDRFLHDRLSQARRAYGWLSEETEDDPSRLDRESVFVVDPIDGTIGFLKGRPQFTICAGLVRGGESVAGVVFNPVTGECFTAVTGGGACLNGARIAASTQETVEGCRMLGSKSLFANPGWSRPPNRPWPAMHIETRSSLAYRVALVAAGQFDAVLALSAKRDWDLAAADIILREAGGRITAQDGRPLRYNRAESTQPSVVCANPVLHARLLERLQHLQRAPS